MPSHVVAQGECLGSIAARYGFKDAQSLYEHADNGELRELRPDPHLLLPGDVVKVPELTLKTCDVATDSVGKFRVTRGKAMFRLVLQDADGEPTPDLPWTLTVGATEHTGTTGGDGLIEVEIPASATEGHLAVQIDPEDPEVLHERELSFGALDPLETSTGIQARLSNMGFGCGKIDGDEAEKTLHALDAFRAREGIEEEGPCGDSTRAKLQELYGC